MLSQPKKKLSNNIRAKGVGGVIAHIIVTPPQQLWGDYPN